MKRRLENIITGKLEKHRRGFGFVVSENSPFDRDIFVDFDNMNGAMDGDQVVVDLLPEYLWGSSPEGIITKILNRSLKEVVGTFERGRRFGFVVPDNKKVREEVFVRLKDSGGAKTGDKVVCQITRYPDRNNSAEGKVSEIVARKGQPGGDIKALIRGYGLRETFPSRASAESKAVSKKGVTEKDIRGRRDLRDELTCTIDGPDSKDFDDAVSLKKLDNGNWLLGVHIADVSHYVEEGGPLDKEALKRGNSVYVIDQVVPMLPRELSNGICSLNPDVDRLTMTCEMEINEDGEVVAHDIYESVIHSDARLVYTDVSDYIEAHEEGAVAGSERDFNGVKELGITLIHMAELAALLRKKRFAEGSIDFNLDEAEVVLDKKGRAIDVVPAERRVANKLIEEFMLLANKTVAEHFYWMDIPFVYRIHEKPEPDKMVELRTFLKEFGINLKGSAANIHPGTLRDVLLEVEGEPCEDIISKTILRSMQKAYYGVRCDGHFGLAFKYYCHFTSPIRRYPDLIIHRIIKEALKGDMDRKFLKHFKGKTMEASEISSATERKAIELEREAEKMKMAEYMKSHVGDEYEGVVSGSIESGIFVQLPNTVEGFVKFERWEKTDKKYALGQPVRIRVKSVDVAERQIDFTLISYSRKKERIKVQ